MSFSFLTELPAELMMAVCSYLNLNSLGKFSQILNRKIHSVTERFLKDIVQALGCPIDDKKSFLRNYNDYVERLACRISRFALPVDFRRFEDIRRNLDEVKETKDHSDVQVRKLQTFDLDLRIEKYPEAEIPADIRKLLNLAEGELSFAQMERLQEFIQARDTLVVWKKIAEEVGIDDLGFNLPQAFVNAHAAITKAEEFSAWLEKEENQEPLERLKSLYLGFKELTTLPPEIRQLRSLRELYLNHNQLTTLPPEIGQLTDLRELGLSGNQLTTLPPEIGQLGSLKGLDLEANQLTTLPPEIGQLTCLQKLKLEDNQLTTLPLEIGQLTSMETLYLDRNQLTTLPPEIGQITSLRRLFLLGNLLTTLPPKIVQLEHLHDLELSNNQLTTLPPEIVQLEHLHYLGLSNNQFTTLPPKIVQLPRLLDLYLLGNPLTSLPSELLENDSLRVIADGVPYVPVSSLKMHETR